MEHIKTQEKIISFFLDEESLHIFDQRGLPQEESWLHPRNLEDIAQAIETLAVRGAPAIGGVAALAVAYCARTFSSQEHHALVKYLDTVHERLARTRPTAVNLFHVLSRMKRVWETSQGDGPGLKMALFHEAKAVCEEDAAACRAMGAHGADLIEDGDVILTICHTGALATCGQGTALGIIRTAHEAGKRISVMALETRPLLQGARLTAWECQKLGVPVTVLTDGMAAFALARRGITKAIAGADRIAKNGDVANKIGTYGVAQLCHAHEVPFYVAAPSTTFDAETPTGAEICIEERHPDEVRRPKGLLFAPDDVPVWNPAFDVTPARLLAGIISENGIWRPPFQPLEWPG